MMNLDSWQISVTDNQHSQTSMTRLAQTVETSNSKTYFFDFDLMLSEPSSFGFIGFIYAPDGRKWSIEIEHNKPKLVQVK